MEKLEYVNPEKIEIHPILKSFPPLTEEQVVAMKTSVAADGVDQPITCVKDGSGNLLVVDGRHRLQAARAAGLKEIKAIIREMTNTEIVDFVLRNAIVGRQLTKTGVCLLLLERHPDLLADRDDRKTKGLKIGISPRVNNINTGPSYRQLADKFQVPYPYFVWVLQAMEICRAKSRDMERLRHIVYAGEVSANRVASSLRGWQEEHPFSDKVDNSDVHETVNRKLGVNLNDGMKRSLLFVSNQAKRWNELGEKEKQECQILWGKTIESLPENILVLTERVIKQVRKNKHQK